MVSAGSVIRGTVINSLLSPGVIVEEGAVVKDSIIFQDCVIGKGASIDLAILDKRVVVGEKAVIGFGQNHGIANLLTPKHLYTGITLIGKGATVPAEQKIGRNCVIDSGITEGHYPGILVDDGESLINAEES
jgi:glucose-1-phosphate adenylyltransferase